MTMIGASRLAVRGRSAMSQRRTFIDWMTNYPDKVSGGWME